MTKLDGKHAWALVTCASHVWDVLTRTLKFGKSIQQFILTGVGMPVLQDIVGTAAYSDSEGEVPGLDGAVTVEFHKQQVDDVGH